MNKCLFGAEHLCFPCAVCFSMCLCAPPLSLADACNTKRSELQPCSVHTIKWLFRWFAVNSTVISRNSGTLSRLWPHRPSVYHPTLFKNMTLKDWTCQMYTLSGILRLCVGVIFWCGCSLAPEPDNQYTGQQEFYSSPDWKCTFTLTELWHSAAFILINTKKKTILVTFTGTSWVWKSSQAHKQKQHRNPDDQEKEKAWRKRETQIAV